MGGAFGAERIGKYISEKTGMKGNIWRSIFCFWSGKEILLKLIRFVLIVFLLLFSVSHF
jgi:hypothetical protein